MIALELGILEESSPNKQWIPACAGMTEGNAGMTEGNVEMTEGNVEMTVGIVGMTGLEKLMDGE